MMDKIEYSSLPGRFVAANEELLSQYSELYSNHYGIWGDKGFRPQKQIRLSNNKLREWLENDSVMVYYATNNEELIGYAIAYSKNEPNYGIVTWVTQLVVHTDYRRHGIAKNILFSIWGFSNHFAWGIVSANPYAIRALEKATRRRAVPMRIKKNVTKLRNIGRRDIPFINEKTEFQVTDDLSTVNTEFFVDHSDTMNMLERVISDDVSWNLGFIEEGWEWFAFTFNDQEQIKLSSGEIEHMVETSDSVVRQAYSKMNLQSSKQTWLKHTVEEINFILRQVELQAVDFVYDLGCGTGRHSIELAKRGISVLGVDYVSENVELARKSVQQLSLSDIEFVEGDCREFEGKRTASLVLCLYDVVGSFASDKDNIAIVKNAFRLLKSGGYAVFSVMNYESTYASAVNVFSFEKQADKILDLSASNTMEESGNIFNPEYYLVDEETHLIYRKEQFSSCTGLPIELVVRDRRFTMDEIVSICVQVGFAVIDVRYTNASDWNKKYEATSKRAKEILLICKKN